MTPSIVHNTKTANLCSDVLRHLHVIITSTVRSPLPLIAIPLLAAAIVNFPAAAQRSQGDDSAKNRSGGGAANEFKFEVLSIKPVKRGSGMQVGVAGPTPNGFTATAYLNQLLAFAYGPPDPISDRTEVRNLPNWSAEDVYVFDARVSQADLKVWQSQGTNRDPLRSALRAALAERFKLALHEEPAQRTMFELVVAKRGPRLKPADPGAKLPSGGVDTGIGPRGIGGWDFHGATMEDLAHLLNFLSNQFDGPVRDRTGLTGRYDFQVPRVATPDENGGYTYSISNLGLELKRGTENRPILVVDHLEKPTPN